MPMSDIEKTRRCFVEAGLAFPTIPDEAAARLKEQRKWLFSTREIETSPYNLQHYVREFDRTHVADYVVLAHSGHGVNSYAVQYYVVHAPWGCFSTSVGVAYTTMPKRMRPKFATAFLWPTRSSLGRTQ